MGNESSVVEEGATRTDGPAALIATFAIPRSAAWAELAIDSVLDTDTLRSIVNAPGGINTEDPCSDPDETLINWASELIALKSAAITPPSSVVERASREATRSSVVAPLQETHAKETRPLATTRRATFP
jgi:hypothetical protein